MQPAALWQPSLGRKLELMSDLPALTHNVAPLGGALPREILFGRLPSWGSSCSTE